MGPRLLVTGFGPFPGMPRNPSGALAQALARSPRWRRLGVAARSLVLPTTYAALRGPWRDALREGAFDAVLMFGVAGRAKRLRVEERAVNRVSRLSPDAEGRRPPAVSWRPAAPPVLRARANAAAMLEILKRHGVAAVRSRDAGRYLCNAAYFDALADARPGVAVLFVHIPQPARSRRPGTRRRPAPARVEAALNEVALALLALGRTM